MAEFDEEGFADAVETPQEPTVLGHSNTIRVCSSCPGLPERDLDQALLAKENGNRSARHLSSQIDIALVYFEKKNIWKL
jgi:hypothetical protein